MRSQIIERLQLAVVQRVAHELWLVVGMKKVEEERRSKSVIDPPCFASWHPAKVRNN
ncbi:hypothetical protein HBI56_203320 [Parastagonospora nodorum]|uniref:Uncharacterized protein n=1 Tax=Phaeosphaeria nodorum (strain SN15 / ATCC MYA-4574 / FGSC 10173) TaxID=321614 RepID=A0A7U2FA77_PHANO|nr:hypothetical protein HBH56_142750 [Parastagonospora nodorum]QRD01544.1 hypothetical protein JI435_416960 [Parastagonospora nodorum SN15]KAH3927771.1 hypothetical protein HBH54_147940 [Parastagonospora nodorum]KAH3947814.1 hypothetical protein HBH53_107980 [Parastagonospora nodorum]KAH3962020.1 hypothetical protein HBH51_179020 [Parastagonospora nodorum]